uniref:Eukaryotic translation initiation factor 3 subunit L n=1 Tax=Lotharella globosa TaxID=91324 RepID=A0A6U3CZR8_9EUKA
MSDSKDFEVDMRKRGEPMFADSTQEFILQLNKAIMHKNIYDIQTLYEHDFERQTTKFYKTTPWPSVGAIEQLVGKDENFLILYQQLYYRHLYGRKPAVGLENQLLSYQNYLDLFNIILGLRTEAPEFEIPGVWLWDIIDEFVYQFSAFHAFRSKVQARESPESTKEDRDLLAQRPHAWSAQTVVVFLKYLAKKGKIPHAGEAGKPHILFETLSVYASIGMLRVNCIMGDYTGGIENLRDIDVLGKHEQVMVPAAHASLHYHLAFAYLMTRRYAECVKCAVDGLTYLSRNKALIPRTYQQNNINKMQEQMFGILALATSLVPQRLEESLASGVQDRFASQMQQMRKMDVDAYRQIFEAVCPKFIPMCMEPAGNNPPEDPLDLQLAVFLDEVRAIFRVPDIYSYLKMCTAINVDRLTSFLGEKDGSLARKLLYLKHKTQSGSLYTENKKKAEKRPEGVPQPRSKEASSSEMQFVVSEEMVHVTEKRQVKQHADFFIREIMRYEYIVADVDNFRRISYF